MIQYEFPIIHTLDDLQPAIDGCSPIAVMERNDYIVVDYLYNTPDLFPAIPRIQGSDEWHVAVLRRECRGIMFNKNGNILSRRFHKFHNFGERPEMMASEIPFDRPHVVLDKEDGSMVSPYVDPADHIKWSFDSSSGYYQKVFWGTMMGWSDIANACSDFVGVSNIDYEGFARECINDGWTPIFEWCSMMNRVVLPHQTSKLILLAIRHNVTGEYKSYGSMVVLADAKGIPVAQSLGSIHGNPTKFLEHVREQETDIEGYVVRWDNGHMAKVKCNWYLRFHNAKENLVHEKDVWKMILANDVDDIMPILMDHDRSRLVIFEKDFWANIDIATETLVHVVDAIRATAGQNRSMFASGVKHSDELTNKMRGMAFRLYTHSYEPTDEDWGLAKNMIIEYAKTATTSAGAIKLARETIKVAPWE